MNVQSAASFDVSYEYVRVTLTNSTSNLNSRVREAEESYEEVI